MCGPYVNSARRGASANTKQEARSSTNTKIEAEEMIGLTRLQTLERQNKDLRIRLENRQGKSELALCAVEDEMKELKARLRDKDNTIVMLQAGYAPLMAENQRLRQQNKDLRAENAALRGALDKAEDRAAKLAAMQKKDSTTSSKPPSNDPQFNKAKATSGREKSGKKPGGQLGHKGYHLKPSLNPDIIINNMPPGISPCCGEKVICDGVFEPRQLIDIEVTVNVTEERSHIGHCTGCGKVWHGEFSEGFSSYVGYGSTVKSMVAALNADANVPVNKTVQFLSYLTEGRLNMSDGTVVNIVSELAWRLTPAIQDIVGALASCGVLNVDETGFRVSGSLAWIQIISNENYSLFGRSVKRGTPNETMDNLILLFTGVLVHDHLKSYYRYTHLSHAECNTHGLRYLKAVTVIMKHPWAEALAKLLTDANKRKKKLIAGGSTGMEEEELADIRGKYENILKQGRMEYEIAINGKKNITYFEEERRLLNRLSDYIDEHLRFLCDFEVPFSNNGAEQGAGYLKSKLRTAGGFRSDGGVDSYTVIASVIATLRKQGMNIFAAIRNAFLGICPRFCNSEDSG